MKAKEATMATGNAFNISGAGAVVKGQKVVASQFDQLHSGCVTKLKS